MTKPSTANHVIEICDDCGHTTPVTTPAMAAYALAKHSCATQFERVARKQRRLDHLALSGPEQPCTHGAQHVHGTYVCYVIDRCKCRPCRDANNIYERARTRQQMYGHAAYVDAGPARAHIVALMAAGMGLKRIVIVSDVSQGLLWKLIYGKTRPNGTRAPSKRIRPVTERTILAVTLDLAGGAKINSAGTARRIQALVATGWSMSKIAARLGIGRSNFTPLAQGSRGTTVARAKAVADLYDQLWDQSPPRTEWRDHIAYSRALGYAAKAGWAPPMAWDDDDIDNPDATPDRGESIPATRQGGGRANLEAIGWLADDGLTLEQVQHRLRVKRSTVIHVCERGDRRDLLERLARNATVQEYAS